MDTDPSENPMAINDSFPAPMHDYRQMSREELIVELETRDREYQHCDLQQATLQLAREQLFRILQAAPVGFCLLDDRGCFEEINPACCLLFGYRREELLGQHFKLLLASGHHTAIHDMLNYILNAGGEFSADWPIEHNGGEKRSIHADAVGITGVDGRPKMIAYLTDITDQKRYADALRHTNLLLQQQVRRDGLTGLLNRRGLREALGRELRRRRRSQAPLTVLMLDLDDFKGINDRFGHQTGDEVLQAVANVIQDSIRDVDHAGRYGGEEFLIVFPESSLEPARQAAERIRSRVQGLTFSSRFALSISGGLHQHDQESAADLVDRADQLLYRAKQAGKNRIIS